MNEPECCPGPSAPTRETLGCVGACPEERVEQHGAQLAPHDQALGRAELGAFNKERVFSERKGRERTEKFS